MKNVTVSTILKKKRAGEKVTMVTAYDYPAAVQADQAGVDMILVGDSLGMTVLGYDTTVQVTMEDMIHHTKAVARGAKTPLIVTDLPFLSYHLSPEDGLRNAGRLLQEGGAQAVKLEGGKEVAKTVEKIVASGIPVMGHLGFTPQSIHKFGGFYFQGKSSQGALELVEGARALEEAGAFAVVLELVPWEVAQKVSEILAIPTIGIGSGPACDGQVQVFHDLFGLVSGFKPRHAKEYAEVGKAIQEGLKEYVREVKEGIFPTEEHTRRMDQAELAEFKRLLEK
jgi:3-methyl-2-oxobutanoate hydroxymethyltransferase